MKQQSMCVIQTLPKPSTLDEDKDWVKKSKHLEGGQWSLAHYNHPPKPIPHCGSSIHTI